MFWKSIKEVSAKWEITYIAKMFREQNKYPLLIFRNPRTCDGRRSKFTAVTNTFGCRRKLAVALDSTFRDVAIDWRRRAKSESILLW